MIFALVDLLDPNVDVFRVRHLPELVHEFDEEFGPLASNGLMQPLAVQQTLRRVGSRLQYLKREGAAGKRHTVERDGDAEIAGDGRTVLAQARAVTIVGQPRLDQRGATHGNKKWRATLVHPDSFLVEGLYGERCGLPCNRRMDAYT